MTPQCIEVGLKKRVKTPSCVGQGSLIVVFSVFWSRLACHDPMGAGLSNTTDPEDRQGEERKKGYADGPYS